MRDVLGRLMELQEVDSKLSQLESLRGDLPHQVSRLNVEYENTKKALENREAQLLAHQKERSTTELEIRALEERQKKYQSQLYEVTNNKEYDAVTHEIEAVKTEIESKESRVLELMDLESETTETIEAAREAIGELDERLNQNRLELQGRLAKTEKEEIALQDKRDKILREITPRIFSSYERIRKAKSGFAVTPVIRNACGGCFTSLPPQRVLEIRKMDRLHLCEVCGRILVWDEKVSEVEV